MRASVSIVAALLFSVATLGCNQESEKKDSQAGTDIESSAVAKLAKCLSDKEVVMYGTSTCSGCRAQRKAFGTAFERIKEVECDPHAPNTKVDLCLERKIRTTPTWIMEPGGKELKRLERYQLLEDLAVFADCEYQELPIK